MRSLHAVSRSCYTAGGGCQPARASGPPRPSTGAAARPAYHAATTPSLRGSVPPMSTPVSGSRQIICPPPKPPHSALTWIRCPSRASCRMTSGCIVDSTCTDPSGARRTLGASNTDCGLRRWSTTPSTVWTCPCGCMSPPMTPNRSEEHTSELQSRENLVCRSRLDSFPTRRSSDLDTVPEPGQLPDDVGVHRGFHMHRPVGRQAHPGRVKHRLRVEAVVDDAQHRVDVPLRLHVAAHDAE